MQLKVAPRHHLDSGRSGLMTPDRGPGSIDRPADRFDLQRNAGNQAVIALLGAAGPVGASSLPPAVADIADRFDLQRNAGNQAVIALLGAAGPVGASSMPPAVADAMTKPALDRGGLPKPGATSQPLFNSREAEADRIAESLQDSARAALTEPVRSDEALPASAADFYSEVLGYDFSRVRIHTDERAAEVAGILGARAFAYRDDVWFGRNEFAPHTDAGLRLLSHELVHVAREARAPVLRRQAIPAELLTSVDHTTMSDEDLHARYDLITSVLAGFDSSSPETAELADEAGRIGVELGRRSALAAGRTFTEQAIERMKAHFIANATGPSPASCIGTLNRGIRLLLDEPAQPVASEIQTTMAKLQTAGVAGAARVIEFDDARGNVTTGIRAPERLHESVWDALIDMSGRDPGWSVFGLSLMDGYHSITLTLDNSVPSNPKVFWSDQWSSRGGWQEFNRAGLDAEITKLTKQWWAAQAADKKSRTRTTLWRLSAGAAPVPVAPMR
jgi:hypothetical protein